MKRTFAIILSGCGHEEGTEITEAVSTLIALSKAGVQVRSFAPDVGSCMKESARITRGKIESLASLNPDEFDAVILPGGFGAAKVLSTWASEGAKCTVNKDVERILGAFHSSQKPIAAICIAPSIVAKVLGKHGVTVTIGNDVETAREIAKTGAQHENCGVNDYVSDRDNKILSTPAYMYDAQPHEVFNGISKMIQELVEMA